MKILINIHQALMTSLAMTLFLAAPDSSAYAINIDAYNRTGKNVNDLHWVLKGPNITWPTRYDGYPDEIVMPTFKGVSDATHGVFEWSGANVLPGERFHFGLAGQPNQVQISELYWTLNGNKVGDIPFINVGLKNDPAVPDAIFVLWINIFDKSNNILAVEHWQGIGDGFVLSNTNGKRFSYGVYNPIQEIPLALLNPVEQNAADYSPFIEVTIPEPGTGALIATTLLGLGFFRKSPRRRHVQV